MGASDVVGLPALMEATSGSTEVVVGMIDGPVLFAHPDLAGAHLRQVPGVPARCRRTDSRACRHGTAVARVLVAARAAPEPGTCPRCPLLVRPIFGESANGDDETPNARPRDLARALGECVTHGARVINLSAGLSAPSTRGDDELEEALIAAATSGAVVVAAAGNQDTVGSSPITRHSAVIPVVAFGANGRPMPGTNLGRSLALRGLGAPGQPLLHASDGVTPSAGTSVATALVSGTVALLWSLFPQATSRDIRHAVVTASGPRRGIVPPLLDVERAHDLLAREKERTDGSNRIDGPWAGALASAASCPSSWIRKG